MWFYVLAKERRDFDPIETLDELRLVLDDHFRNYSSEKIVLLSSDSWEVHDEPDFAWMNRTAADLAGSIDFIGIFSSSSAVFAVDSVLDENRPFSDRVALM